MAIEYQFLDRDDETLIETSELPVEEGIAVAIRTTGYEIGEDEIVELAIVGLDGSDLFSERVKPQNIDEWSDKTASGAIMPADVAEAPELYQFEDEIRELFENASIVVGLHMDFIGEMIEASWVALPDYESFDLLSQFCASHSAADYPSQPAAVASLEGIAGYYGLPDEEDSLIATAQTVATCYRKLIGEHAQVRIDKGAEYWERYRQRVEEAERNDASLQAAKRNQEVRALRINAVLWLCAAAIFSNLAMQLHLRSFDFGIVAIAAAAAVFFAIRWILSLYAMYKIRKGS